MVRGKKHSIVAVIGTSLISFSFILYLVISARLCCDAMGQETGLSVDTSKRSEVASFHAAYFAPSFGSTSGWSGSTATCNPGTISDPFRDDVIQLVNYFRAMAGLPGDVVLDPALNDKTQDLALMMLANDRLSHYWGPVSDPTTCPTYNPDWSCYTVDGCEAGKSSNIANGYSNAGLIVGFMDDYGSRDSLGHRRWMLYPPQVIMGLGAAQGSRAYSGLWVFGPFGSRPADPEYVAWPPPGYVPYPLVYRVWSFSVPVHGALDNAAVAVMQDGQSVALTSSVLPKYYGDDTISWEFATTPSFGA
jgi:hypothetical protein